MDESLESEFDFWIGQIFIRLYLSYGRTLNQSLF